MSLLIVKVLTVVFVLEEKVALDCLFHQAQIHLSRRKELLSCQENQKTRF